MNPTLSVIIPIYRVENYLERCVLSVLNQDYRDIEVILVDDGSPDRCPLICDELAKTDDRIVVIHKPNGGLSSARNKGIEYAKGRYLAFLDSDDQWAAGKLKDVIAHLVREDVDMLVFDAIDIYDGDVKRKRNNHGFFEQEYQMFSIEDYYAKIIGIGDYMESACTKIVSRDFINAHNLIFFEGITGEDTEWMMRLLRCAKKVAISNVELFHCTCGRIGSIQNTIKPKNIRDLINTVDKCIEFYQQHPEVATQKYEYEQCAYLIANATGLLRYIDDKLEKKSLIGALKQRAYLFKYSSNRKTKKVRLIYRIFGYDVLVWFLETYMLLKKKNIMNHKKKIHG